MKSWGKYSKKYQNLSVTQKPRSSVVRKIRTHCIYILNVIKIPMSLKYAHNPVIILSKAIALGLNMLWGNDCQKHVATCQNRSQTANDFGKFTTSFVNLNFVVCWIFMWLPLIIRQQNCMHIKNTIVFYLDFKGSCNVFQSSVQLSENAF